MKPLHTNNLQREYDSLEFRPAAPTGGATPAEENDKKTKEALPHLMALVRVGYSQAALDLAEYCSANNVTPEFQDQVISMLNSGNKRKFSSELFAKELAEVEKELTPPVMEGATAEEILAKHCFKKNVSGNVEYFESEVIAAMHEYASQFATLPGAGAGVAVTEEALEQMAEDYVRSTQGIVENSLQFMPNDKKQAWIAGYKAKHQ